jgi:dTDP-4-amino-4,6-dideoxygalactose transaminase
VSFPKDEPRLVFSRPYRSTGELENLEAVLASGHVHGDGPFTASATATLKKITGAHDAFLTSSCTHALEMSSLLLDVGPGDEVIMPSFTFPSAADAIALRGARIVFVDIEENTGNVDAELVERQITNKTKAISIVHYGGVAADMGELLRISGDHGIPIIEDNAHALGGRWRGKSLGTLGSLATQSFHDTKNVQCGEGGAILINDPALVERAEIIREKGTDRSRFLRGQVDKYTWADIGSSYLPSELNAAVLDAQLADFDVIQSARHSVWDAYATRLADWATDQGVRLMSVPDDRDHTAHLFFMVLPTHDSQGRLIAHLAAHGIVATFHYVPLDTSPAGVRFGSAPEPCVVSQDFSSRLVRLPLWAGMTEHDVERVISGVQSFSTSQTRSL